MYLPDMRKIHQVQVSYIAPSAMDAMIGPWFGIGVILILTVLPIAVFVYLVLSAVTAIAWAGAAIALMLAVLFADKYCNYARAYKEVMDNCGQRYQLKPNCYFLLLRDMAGSRNFSTSIAIAFDFESSDPLAPAFAEYRIDDLNIENRECDEYLLKTENGQVVEQEFTTKFGFMVKVYGMTKYNELDFEIVGLKKLGRTFKKLKKD